MSVNINFIYLICFCFSTYSMTLIVFISLFNSKNEVLHGEVKKSDDLRCREE